METKREQPHAPPLRGGVLRALCIVLAIAFGSSPAAEASKIAQDNFDYPDGTIVGQGTAGNGWAGGWRAAPGNGSVASGVLSVTTNNRFARNLATPLGTDGTTIYIGMDLQLGGFYSGFEGHNGSDADSTRVACIDWQTNGGAGFRASGGTGAPQIDIDDTAAMGLHRYVLEINYGAGNADTASLYMDGNLVGKMSGTADLTLDRVGFAAYQGGSVPHAGHFVIATTFDEANGGVPFDPWAGSGVWTSSPPAGTPFPTSSAFSQIYFTGRHASYGSADTWYPSWASDDNLYSPWTDGTVNGDSSFSGGSQACTGQARIEGNDPLHLTVVSLGTYPGAPQPYGGRYPCGSLVYNGIWYYGTYGLQNASYGLNWPILGPTPGFRISRDFGRTWEDPPHTCDPTNALFPEPSQLNGPVKIGSPHFVDFGKNMEHSPDGKTYLVAHGSTEPDQQDRQANLSWITGDQIYLCRVVPTPENINDASKYEYFSGHDASGNALWTSDFSKIQPLIDWNNNCGCVTITYNAPLQKYLMCVTDGWPTIGTMNTYVLESDSITGPWSMVTYMKQFGVQGYFVNIPSKFISADGKTMWLCYSANFTKNQPANPPGSSYSMTLQEIKLLPPSDLLSNNLAPGLNVPSNVAPLATLTASSSIADYPPSGAVDRSIGPESGQAGGEWATTSGGAGAWIRLDWSGPVTVNSVALFDRSNSVDQITAGRLVFSDGSTLDIGELPDDGKLGIKIGFPPKTIEWVRFEVLATKAGSTNIGLAEIAVFTKDPISARVAADFDSSANPANGWSHGVDNGSVEKLLDNVATGLAHAPVTRTWSGTASPPVHMHDVFVSSGATAAYWNDTFTTIAGHFYHAWSQANHWALIGGDRFATSDTIFSTWAAESDGIYNILGVWTKPVDESDGSQIIDVQVNGVSLGRKTIPAGGGGTGTIFATGVALSAGENVSFRTTPSDPTAGAIELAATITEVVAPPATLRIESFQFNPANGDAELRLNGQPGINYTVTQTTDLDFINNSSLVSFTGATVGTLEGDGVTTDSAGNAAVQFNLGTNARMMFFRAELR